MAPRRHHLWFVVLFVVVVSLVLGACAAPAQAPAATKAPAAAAGGDFKLGIVHPSPITDSWSGLAWAAAQRAEKELGAKIANVQVGDPAGYEKAFSDFGSQGYNVVVGHGYQYDDAAAKVAPQFPKTYYIIVNGSSVGPNLAGINTIPGYMQVMYAAGAMAGKISKTHKCAAFTLELPATKLPNQAFIAGFESIAGNKCSLVTLNDQNDVGAAKEAALQAMAEGADILSANANLAGSGVWQAVAEKGDDKVFAVGTVGNVNDQAPKNMLVSMTQDAPTSIFNAIKAVKEGTLKPGTSINLNIKNPGDLAAYPIVFNDGVDPKVLTPEMKADLQATIAKIQSGALQVPGVQ